MEVPMVIYAQSGGRSSIERMETPSGAASSSGAESTHMIAWCRGKHTGVENVRGDKGSVDLYLGLVRLEKKYGADILVSFYHFDGTAEKQATSAAGEHDSGTAGAGSPRSLDTVFHDMLSSFVLKDPSLFG